MEIGMHGLAQNVEIRVIGALVAAGNAIDNNSTRIDMADYESVTFVAPITDSVATGVATLLIEENDADSDVGMVEVAGTAASRPSVANDDINGQALVSEVFKPNKRWVQAVRRSATANIAFGDIIAILVPRRLPAVQGATVAAVARAAN
jgi:hypothetical protein